MELDVGQVNGFSQSLEEAQASGLVHIENLQSKLKSFQQDKGNLSPLDPVDRSDVCSQRLQRNCNNCAQK